MTNVASALAAVVPLDVPVGWPESPDVNTVHTLLIFVGIPMLLFVLITLAVYLPSVVRGERIAPGQPPVEDQWLGGPRTGTAELKGPDAQDAEAGGASGRW